MLIVAVIILWRRILMILHLNLVAHRWVGDLSICMLKFYVLNVEKKTSSIFRFNFVHHTQTLDKSHFTNLAITSEWGATLGLWFQMAFAARRTHGKAIWRWVVIKMTNVKPISSLRWALVLSLWSITFRSKPWFMILLCPNKWFFPAILSPSPMGDLWF